MSWIASDVVLQRAHDLVARELGVLPKASRAALRSALREADQLADDVFDVPAALLYSLGRTPRCFRLYRTMSVVVVAWHAKTLGFALRASPCELAEVLERAARREVDFEDVKAWVCDRMLPFGG